MKKLLTTILLTVSATAFTNQAAADDRWETLRAINWVENPTNHTRKGRFGELGPYQFRPTTWKMHTTRPFRQAVEREAADEVAVEHYEWIKRTLVRGGVDPTPFNIAMAWNSGVENVLKGRVPEVSYDYATRVTNLVQVLKDRAAAAGREVADTRAAVPAAAGPRAENPVFSLESPVVAFTVAHDAPKFDLATPLDVEIPVVYTDDAPEAVAPMDHSFTFTTAAALTPRFRL